MASSLVPNPGIFYIDVHAIVACTFYAYPRSMDNIDPVGVSFPTIETSLVRYVEVRYKFNPDAKYFHASLIRVYAKCFSESVQNYQGVAVNGATHRWTAYQALFASYCSLTIGLKR
jgi:hypothetical protein